MKQKKLAMIGAGFGLTITIARELAAHKKRHAGKNVWQAYKAEYKSYLPTFK